MKKFTAILMSLITCACLCAFALTACADNDGEEYAPPPADVVNPDGDNSDGGSGTNTPAQNGVITNAVSVKIGLNDNTVYSINMYDNAAVNTMMGYLSSSEMRFPTYTYNETAGFVAQSIRGNYTKSDEIKVENIKMGELYLMSGGQLRLYFKDVAGANITATPVGYFADSSHVENAVKTAYTENQGDTWGVDVYFLITKNTK